MELSSSIDEAISVSIADGVSRQVDPRWIIVRRVRGLIFTAVVTMGSLTMILLVSITNWSPWPLLVLPVWATAVGALAWHTRRWPEISYRHVSYRVDESGLEIQRGVYWRTVTNVPRSRIQHTDVSQGPLERRHDLGTLVVYTAGTQHSQVKLPGLEYTIAQRIRTHLLPSDHGDAV